MKNLITISLSILLIFGFISMKGQNRPKDLNEIRILKHQSLKGSQLYNYKDQVFSQRRSERNINRAVMYYGDMPGLNWKGQFGGSGYDNVNAVISDETGNIFITGGFSGEMSLAGNSYITTGNREAFVAKLNSSGELVWFTQIPAAENKITDSKDICLGADGNLYITGYYTGSITIGETDLPDVNGYSLFYAKLNTQGEVLSGAFHSVTDNEIGFSIDTDSDGNIYIVSARSTTEDSRHPSFLLKYDRSNNLIREVQYEVGFNNLVVTNGNIYYSGVIRNGDDGYLDENISLTPPSYYDIFIAKSNLDGVFEWGYTLTHYGNGHSRDDCLIMDNQGNFFMAGIFQFPLIFGNDTIFSNYGEDSFITKIDPQGNFIWAESYDNTKARLSSDLSGNAFVAVDDSLRKYNTNGIMVWKAALVNQPNAICTNSENKIIHAGSNKGLIYVNQLNNEASGEWSIQFEGNSGIGYQIGMVTDRDGNVYTYNYTSNTIDYFGETVNEGVFLCKQNNKGEVVWIKQFPNIRVYGGYGNYIAIDPANENIYITGQFYDELVIPGETTLIPGDDGSIFILKYAANGDYIWSLKEDFYGEGLSLTADYANNVILSGMFAKTISISGTELVTAGNDDCFIAKYDADANLEWAMRAGGEDSEWSGFVSPDGDNNLYLTAEFDSEHVTIGTTEYEMPEGEGNIILAKLTSSGDVLWIKSFAASQNPNEWWDWYCWPTGIKTDVNGNTYIKGAFGKGAYFDDIYLENSLSGFNKFILKTDSSGNALWAKPITRHGKAYQWDYNQFDMDSQGNVYFGMQTEDTLFFGDDFQYNTVSPNDLIVAKYSTNGNLDWVISMQGEPDAINSYNRISSVAVSDTNNIFVGGYFTNFLTIDTVKFTSKNRNGFLAKFGNNSIGINEIHDGISVLLYPNPAKDKITVYKGLPFNNARATIYSVSGKLVKTATLNNINEIDVSNLPDGMYLLKIYNRRSYFTGKFVKK